MVRCFSSGLDSFTPLVNKCFIICKIFLPAARLSLRIEEGTMVNLNLTMADAQNESIRLTVQKERKRLLDFIMKRVPTQEDAEDILQDVFYELVNTYRLMKPVEQIASWL